MPGSLKNITTYLDELGYDSYVIGQDSLVKIELGSSWCMPSRGWWSNVLVLRRSLRLHRRLVLLLNQWRLPCSMHNKP